MIPDDLSNFLKLSDVLDGDDPAIKSLANQLAAASQNQLDLVKRSFEWVRDQIPHSIDHKADVVTCSASEVLKHRTGLCYAKSHLLATLLRLNGIPTAFCYQRLTLDGKGSPFCLHGFNAVHLDEFGWYRIDARGNRPDVLAQFSPPVEQLAFIPSLPGEITFSELLPEPLPVVVSALWQYNDCKKLVENLPDWSSLNL